MRALHTGARTRFACSASIAGSPRSSLPTRPRFRAPTWRSWRPTKNGSVAVLKSIAHALTLELDDIAATAGD